MFLLLMLTTLTLILRGLALIGVKYTTTSLTTKKVLQYRTGTEHIESIVVSAATVTAGGDGRKVLEAGSLLCRITASSKFGPYASGASDGRQTLGAPDDTGIRAVILTNALDVTDGDKPLGGYYGMCSFDASELTLFGATLANTRAAFPTCAFL